MRSSPLLPIFLIVAVDVLGLTIILPLLPFYAERYGATPTVVGLLVATYAACQLIAAPLLGRLSDKTGRRPLLLVSQMGTFAGFLVLAFANSLWLIFLSRIIDGITAGNLSLAQAYIADITKPEERAQSFGVIGIAFGLGFLIGPGISGFLSQFGYQYPVFAAAGLSLTSILATYFLLPSTKPHGHDDDPGPGGRRLAILDWGAYGQYFQRPGLAPLLWQFLAFVFSFATFTSGFALFAERRFTWDGRPFGPKQVGYAFAYVGFLGVIMQGFLLKRLVKRFGEQSLVRFGFMTSVIGYAGLALARSVPALVVVSTISAMGGALRPSLTSLITQKANRNEQGVVVGLTQSFTSMSGIIAPPIAGFLIGQRLLSTWALWASAVAAMGLWIALSRRSRTEPN